MTYRKLNRTRAAAALFTCGIVAAGVTAGCGDKAPETSSTTVINQAAPETSRSAPVPVPGPSGAVVTNDTNAGAGGATGTQTALADEITKIITRNTQMTGSRVNVVVDDAGVATLTGFTQNQQQKALAEKAAKNTTGVSLVSNKLDIRPTGGTGKAKPAPAAPQTQIIVVPGAPAPAAPGPPATAPTVSGAPAAAPGGPPAGSPVPTTEGGTAPVAPPAPPTNP